MRRRTFPPRSSCCARDEFPLALETVYFGGGTPSLLPAKLFAELAWLIHEGEANDSQIAEFTLEVNPATVTAEKAAAWRAAGVNRISLGAQSFDPTLLKTLGRTHAPEDIPATVELLREHGFANINLDLMFALPGQSEGQWDETLRAALACGPQHISAYALTYEEDTPFFEKLSTGEWRQDEQREITMFERTRQILFQRIVRRDPARQHRRRQQHDQKRGTGKRPGMRQHPPRRCAPLRPRSAHAASSVPAW